MAEKTSSNLKSETTTGLSANEKSQAVSDWVDQYGDDLYRFAFARLRDQTSAEDVVQEAFIAAFKSLNEFRSESTVKTWLISILRNKIVDFIRKDQREKAKPVSFVEDVNITSGSLDGNRLKEWDGDPSNVIENQEFWEIFNNCVAKLPENLAESFLMREINGIPVEDVCKIVGITSTNVSVRVYRARVFLRHCLDKNWFNPESDTP